MGSLAVRLFCWFAAVMVVVAMPSAEISLRNARGQTVVDSSDPFGQGLRSQGPVESLAYYGGAKGQFLLIHPGGQRTISRSPPPLRAKEEEDVGMATEEEEGDNESVAINPPPENASVAEAKPVGLAIAGPGGVASSKPVGQAIVGPGGLAVARPIATAIAGVQGGGVPGAVAIGGKDQQNAAGSEARLKQVFFDPETNQLHLTPFHGHRYLFPVNLY